MSDDDIPPPRFVGRTYSRVKHSAASKRFDETVDSKNVSVKTEMSVSKWGHANYLSVREGLDSSSAPKKVKMEKMGPDPFSFDTEDKRRSSLEKHALPEQEVSELTKLSVTKIGLKGKEREDYMNVPKEEATRLPAIHSSSRNLSQKCISMDQSVDEGRKTEPGQSLFLSEASLSPQDPLQETHDYEDDDFGLFNFMNDLAETNSCEDLSPVDKPESPQQSKFDGKKGVIPRDRKSVTVPESGLIVEHKRNYAAQALKEKTDREVKRIKSNTMVTKQDLVSSEDNINIVSHKPVKADKQANNVVRNSKPRDSLVSQISDSSTSQEATRKEIGRNDLNSSIANNMEKITTRTSLRLKTVPVLTTEKLSSPNGSTSSLSSPASAKQAVRHSASIAYSKQPLHSSQSSSDNSSQSNGSQGHSTKRYRIFKSRAPQIEELKIPVLKEEDSSECSPHSIRYRMNNIGDSHVQSIKYGAAVSDQGDFTSAEEAKSPLKSLSSSQTSYSAQPDIEPSNTNQTDHVNTKQIDPLAARELLAARLRNIDKNNESDSTSDFDNASECSESLPSQETLSNSQTTSEGGSQNENSTTTVAPRKFFKSKKSLSGGTDLQRIIFGSSPQKIPAKASYNARSWHSKHEADSELEVKTRKTQKKDKDADIVLIKNSEKEPKLKREVHWPERKYDDAYTSLKVSKAHKELYTVVHNVKQTHEVQELGETQDFMDEVDYLLDSLQNTNSTGIRCLSCLKLASKCISPAFRMHMRAHGTVSKIFSLLYDAASDPSLALSTSAMMFMLSRDRLNMDLDHDSLSLMLKLNEVDAGDSLQELDKTKQKVKELLAQLQQETHAREIDLGFVSTSNLALESLLSLTSRRAGEWFKEELRSVGGLDHIVDSVKFCEKSLPEDLSQDIQKALPILRKLDRCLRVLENISYMNPDNQTYLILYKNAVLLQACTRTLRLCQLCMPTYKLFEGIDERKALQESPGYTILMCLLGVLRVMLNITHENQLGDLDVAHETSLMETVLRCLTTTLWCIPSEQRFDVAVLCLGLLINLVEHREANRRVMMNLETQVKYAEKSQPKTMSAIKAVVELFVQREQAAREMEEDTEGTQDTSLSPNKSGEWMETDSGIQWITSSLMKAKEEQEKAATGSSMEGDEGNQSILEEDEETFTKALHKAGKHMENSIVASYAGLLLGSTVVDSQEYASSVKKLIPNEDFGPMIRMLRKFLNFMSLTTAFGNTDVNGITKVIEVLESA